MYHRRGGRKKGIILGVILGILIILLVLIFSVRIKDVEVSGNKQYTKEQIESLLFDGKWSRNSAFCYYQNRFKEARLEMPYKINRSISRVPRRWRSLFSRRALWAAFPI